MKERPILFSAPMVRAILEGRKTQTRRIVKPNPILPYPQETYRVEVDKFGGAQWRYDDPTQPNALAHVRGPDEPSTIYCKKGSPGDLLWVRESLVYDCDSGWRYAANEGFPDRDDYALEVIKDFSYSRPQCPSIHMPRRASRITLEILRVRVERLQDISERDAESEGVQFMREIPDADETLSARTLYEILWESINGNGSWDKNPWVWVIEFKRA